MPERRTVALVTLGCARNEVDSEELAGRLAADGWELVENAEDADVAVVNTCGFVEAARRTPSTPSSKPMIWRTAAAPRPWSPSAAWPSGTARSSAEALPEADGVLGFDDYADISNRLQTHPQRWQCRGPHPA
ncbi:30S ribosomal protein S12 methylthiotransferase RimO [Streptomyces tanashiensis]